MNASPAPVGSTGCTSGTAGTVIGGSPGRSTRAPSLVKLGVASLRPDHLLGIGHEEVIKQK